MSRHYLKHVKPNRGMEMGGADRAYSHKITLALSELTGRYFINFYKKGVFN